MTTRYLDLGDSHRASHSRLWARADLGESSTLSEGFENTSWTQQVPETSWAHDPKPVAD